MTPEGISRKLIAILSADVKDYTRLMSQDDVGTIRTLTVYKEAMETLIRRYRGQIVDATGDNLLARFDSVLDAVNAAAETQRDLAERNTDLPYHRKMEFRMGVSLGDVVEEEGRIYGDGVNIAARLQALAEGGGICISGMVHDSVKGKLGFEYEDIGEQTLKNIAEPVRVYRLLSHPGAAAHRVKEAKRALRRKWGWVGLAAGAIIIIGSLAIWRFVIHPARGPQVASTEPYMYQGQPEEAIKRVKEAMRLNPYYPNWYLWMLGCAQYVAHDYEGGIETFRKMSPMGEGRKHLAACLAYLGRMEEAHAEAEKFLKDNPSFSASAWASSHPFLHDKDRQHAMEGFIKAGLPR
jgi:class 3 adenylate cyclase